MFQGETKNTKRLAYPRSLFDGIMNKTKTGIWVDIKSKIDIFFIKNYQH